MEDDRTTDVAPGSDDIEVAVHRREQAADRRELDLDAREYRVLAREDAESERANEVREINAAADERDELADARDTESSRRDMAANLEDWIHKSDDDKPAEARGVAWNDRMHSRRDRIASGNDRDHLTRRMNDGMQ
jgi:hypothetical protein